MEKHLHQLSLVLFIYYDFLCPFGGSMDFWINSMSEWILYILLLRCKWIEPWNELGFNWTYGLSQAPFRLFCLVLYHQLSQKLGCSVTPKCKAWFGDLSKHNSKLGQHNSAYTKIKFLNKKSHLKKKHMAGSYEFFCLRKTPDIFVPWKSTSTGWEPLEHSLDLQDFVVKEVRMDRLFLCWCFWDTWMSQEVRIKG